MKKLLTFNYNIVTKRPGTILILALILSVIAIFLASGLNLELSWVALAPKGHPAVAEYDQILEDFPAIDNIIVVVETDDPEEMKGIVDKVEAGMNELTDYVSSVTAGIDPGFSVDYSLNYMTDEDAEVMGYLFMNPNVDTFYIGMGTFLGALDQELADTELTDEEAMMIEGSIKALTAITEATVEGLGTDTDEMILAQRYDEALIKMVAGEELITSPDGNMTTVMVRPSFDMMDLVKLEPGIAAMEDVVFGLRDDYPDAMIGITGIHVVARDETASIQSDSQLTTLLAVVFILLLMYIAFRVLSAPLFTFTPLVVGIIWAVGLIQIVIGRLSMLTAFSAAMIIGLGIDFSIHLYSAYTENRSKGHDKLEALKTSMLFTGPSIIVGGLTTACAFLALNISNLDMLAELGTVMAMGIGTTLLAVFWVLPAMIMLKKEKEKNIIRIKGSYTIIGNMATLVNKNRIVAIIVLVVFTGTMGFFAKDIEFDLDLMNLEPLGLESIELMEYMVEEYDMSTDALNVEVDSLEEVYRLEALFSDHELVSDIASIVDIMPKENSRTEFDERQEIFNHFVDNAMPARDVDPMMMFYGVDLLAENADTLKDTFDEDVVSEKEINALKSSVKELEKFLEDADMEQLNAVNDTFYESYSKLGGRIADGNYLTVDRLPDAFKSQFVSEDGNHYLISFYPSFGIWDNLKSDKGTEFIDMLTEEAPGLTGTPMFMKVMYETAASEALTTGIIILVVLFLILLVHFRSIKFSLLAFIPLAIALTASVGTMVLIDLDFNILNFLGLLLIIGIGVDYGVHIIHHYLDSDKTVHEVFASVGRAILLTTLTTIIGFGSLMFSSYRGVASLGNVLVIGVGYAFIMTVLIIPIFLKDRIKEEASEE